MRSDTFKKRSHLSTLLAGYCSQTLSTFDKELTLYAQRFIDFYQNYSCVLTCVFPNAPILDPPSPRSCSKMSKSTASTLAPTMDPPPPYDTSFRNSSDSFQIEEAEAETQPLNSEHTDTLAPELEVIDEPITPSQHAEGCCNIMSSGGCCNIYSRVSCFIPSTICWYRGGARRAETALESQASEQNHIYYCHQSHSPQHLCSLLGFSKYMLTGNCRTVVVTSTLMEVAAILR